MVFQWLIILCCLQKHTTDNVDIHSTNQPASEPFKSKMNVKTRMTQSMINVTIPIPPFFFIIRYSFLWDLPACHACLAAVACPLLQQTTAHRAV